MTNIFFIFTDFGLNIHYPFLYFVTLKCCLYNREIGLAVSLKQLAKYNMTKNCSKFVIWYFLPYRPPLAERDQTHHPAQSIHLNPSPSPGPRLCPCNAISPLPLCKSVHATVDTCYPVAGLFSIAKFPELN